MEEWGAAAVPGQLEPGQRFGDYEILTTAGEGGMGVVYKSRQRSLGRVVALKVIRSEIACVPQYRDRFLREARLAASVDHPHVVPVYHVGDEDDRLFLAIQWIDGEDLKRVIEGSGRLPPDRAVTIATQLAGALDAVHSIGLVHRDVKPANVLLRRIAVSDHAYLTDFGIAKPSQATERLTQTGWMIGTAGYVSPEQIQGLEPGPQSDLYALGCVAFEALTGHQPFAGETDMALCWAHANDPRPIASDVVPTLSTRYDRFFEAALAVDPEDRFCSGRDFADALATAHASGTAPAVTATVSPSDPRAISAVPIRTASTKDAATLPARSYPAYGYVTPRPPASPPSRSSNTLVLILLGIIALTGTAFGTLAAAGVFSRSGNRRVSSAALSRAASTQHGSAASTAPASAGSSQSRRATGSRASGRTSCGGDLSVGPNTSCGFAHNVEQAYARTGGGYQVVTSYSPAAARTFTIDCTAGSLHVCSRGTTHNASVYFTSGPGAKTCNANISVNAVTTCRFAANVFRAYVEDFKANGAQSSVVVSAYSPVTRLTYAIDCITDDVTVICTGGNSSFVTFSMGAVRGH